MKQDPIDEAFKRIMEKHGKEISRKFRAYCENEAKKKKDKR